jgi:L-alanine-DL-glutamate epimerase-like enolase superfamily enzyme
MLFDKDYGRAGYSHYPELTKLGVLSAIEMACWDVIGKDCGQPVYRLLGGQMRDRVRTYTYIYDDPAARAGDGGGAPLSRDVWDRGRGAADRAATRAIRSALVRGALPAGEHGGAGRGRAADHDPDRDR